MAAKTERYGEVLGSTEIATTRERDGVLHITINLLNVMPAREVHVRSKGSETASSHYWMNSLPFVKQSS
jgi:hypothetical protein